MIDCDSAYVPSGETKEKEFVRHILSHTGAEQSATAGCTARRIAIQNDLAAQYYSPYLRYTPACVDNSKEIEFLKSVAQKGLGNPALNKAMGDYLSACEKNYRPSRRPVDNSKEITFLKRIGEKIAGYFRISPESAENARKSTLGKRAGLYTQPSPAQAQRDSVLRKSK